MKVNKKLFCFALAAMALSSCNMDYNEYLTYDKEYIGAHSAMWVD